MDYDCAGAGDVWLVALHLAAGGGGICWRDGGPVGMWRVACQGGAVGLQLGIGGSGRCTVRGGGRPGLYRRVAVDSAPFVGQPFVLS